MSLLENRIEEIKNDLINKVHADVEEVVSKGVNERFKTLTVDEKQQVIEAITSHYLRKLDEDGTIAALTLQLKGKIDNVERTINNSFSELRNEVNEVNTQVSFLNRRFNDINPTIQSNIQSFSNATESYKEIAHDLRERTQGLATKEGLTAALARMPGRFEFYGLAFACTSLLLAVLTFVSFTLDSKYTGFQQNMSSQLQDVKNTQQQILQRMTSTHPANP